MVVVAALALVLGWVGLRALPSAGGASSTAGGLSVFVGYAEDKETINPDPATFPVPWAGSPRVTFLGGTVPGQAACGTLATCYDAGAIRLDNPTTAPITVSRVTVDDHSSLPGGKVFDNLWGSFTVPPGQSVILTENPPASNPGFDNFDTSGFPATCTPITVPPTVTITVGGNPTTLADTTHVIDSGGIDAGSCSPKTDESIQWRPIGSPGTTKASLTLAPSSATAAAGSTVTETATLLDGSGQGIPHAAVAFVVTGGPDAGTTGTGVTDTAGNASYPFSGTPGEDTVVAQVTTVGTFTSLPSHVLWTDDTTTGWTGTDIGAPLPPGGQSLAAGSGTWTVSGGGTGLGGTADQLHLVSKAVTGAGGVAARVTSLSGGRAGVMLRSTADPASPYYAAMVAPDGDLEVLDRTTTGGPTATVVDTSGGVPASLWVARAGSQLTTYTSPDGITWTPLPGSTVNADLGGSITGGLAVSSGQSGSAATATFDSVLESAGPPSPLPPVACPAPFSCADIGSPTPAGSQSYDPNSGTWTIAGGGSDISGLADQFRFVSQPLSGDGTVSAHVATQSNSGSQAKAGVMVRATADPGAPEYSVVVSPGAGIKVQLRTTQGGNTAKLANPAGTTPAYLEITRAGNTLTASTSPDGTTWTAIPGSATTLSLPSTVLAGLAVTSHNSGQLSTVTMDTVSPGVDGSIPPTTTTTTTSTTRPRRPRRRPRRNLRRRARRPSAAPTSVAPSRPAASPMTPRRAPGPSPPAGPTSSAPPTSSASCPSRSPATGR